MRQDVVIVGGGPAGAACAIALARGGARCALFERSASPAFKPGEVVNPEAQVPLRELGLWESFLARGDLRSAGTVSVWGDAPAWRSAVTDPFGGSFLVDRGDFESWLLDAASEAGASIVRGAGIISARRAFGGWSLEVQDAQARREAAASFIVEATGRGRSVVGRGARRRVDSLTALLAYAQSPTADTRLSIESAPDGWWYAAPLPEGRLALAFLTDADLLPGKKDARTQYFRRRLETSALIRERFPPENFTGQVLTAPAASTIRRDIGGEGWVALADAAATYDPLMGVGVAVALSKGLALARLLLNDAAPAERYEQAERAAFDDYLRARRSVYGAERRWAEETFWRRRGVAHVA